MTLVKNKTISKLNDDLRGLIHLSNHSFDNFNDALHNYIQFGMNKIGFETGMVSRVEGNVYTILEVIGSEKVLNKGMEVPLENTLCKRAVETKNTLVSTDVNNTDLYDLPARKMLNISSIICTPLTVNQQIFGTLTFCSKEVKENTELWDYSVSIVEILGQTICKILKESLDKKALEAKSTNLKQFNEDLRAFAKIGAANHTNFLENLMAYINFGKKITGFENVIISEIKNDIYTIIQASLPNHEVQPGDIFKVCDTLCQEVIEKQQSVTYHNIKYGKYYHVFGREYLGTEACIMIPLRVDDKIIGVVSFCATARQEDNDQFKYAISIIELIAEKIGKLVKQNKLTKELQREKMLLKMGAEVFEMASYNKSLNNDILVTTPEFKQIFDIENIDPKEATSAKKMIKIIGHKVIEADKTCFLKNIKKSTKKNIDPFEYRIRTHNGKIKWLRHQLKLDKTNQCILGVVQNITPLKKAQEKLQFKNNELEQFAYATAHDLQEPLRTISGYSKILSQTCFDKLDDKSQEYFTYLTDASDRMKEQIDGLLDHSKIGIIKEKAIVNMNDVLSDVLADLKNSIDKTNAEIIIQNLPDVKGYKTELRLLLLNLISNALKFVQPNISPIIEVGFNSTNNYYTSFYVKDNGIGISKKNIHKIFNLFARLNKRTKYEGTGIGLTHCKKIVDLHGGEIQVDSELGKGATINFTIIK